MGTGIIAFLLGLAIAGFSVGIMFLAGRGVTFTPQQPKPPKPPQ